MYVQKERDLDSRQIRAVELLERQAEADHQFADDHRRLIQASQRFLRGSRQLFYGLLAVLGFIVAVYYGTDQGVVLVEQIRLFLVVRSGV